jgi:hypothetical protein
MKEVEVGGGFEGFDSLWRQRVRHGRSQHDQLARRHAVL